MKQEELLETVGRLITLETNVPIENLKLDTRLDQLDIDSLDVLKLAARFEREFKIEISTAELLKIETIGDIVTGLGPRITG